MSKVTRPDVFEHKAWSLSPETRKLALSVVSVAR